MKERPILFSGPMVRAIIEGRKTQTRRVIKPQPAPQESVQYDTITGQAVYESDESSRIIDCPYGGPFSRLWVRESLKFDPDNGWLYAAGPSVMTEKECEQHHGQLDRIDFSYSRPSCPSIHMPRKASRITLEIVAVRVERLQSISYDDAVAEGIEHEYPKAVAQYRDLWEQINGPGSWDANPWVWVVEFKRI